MKILLVKSSALGDIIHCYPLVAYLKKKFPTSTLEWVVEAPFSSLVERHPLVDRAHLIQSKKWRKKPLSYFQEMRPFKKERYDLAFDLQGNVKSSLILRAIRAQEKIGFGGKSVPEWPNLLFTTKRYNPPKGGNIREDYLYLAQQYFDDFSLPEKEPLLTLSKEEARALEELPKESVLVAPHSRWPNKEISDERVLSHLEGRKNIYFLWKGEKEKKRVEELQKRIAAKVLPELSLPLLQHLIAQSSLVIAVDSLVLHLAGTTKTATLSFFGPSSAQKYAPLGARHTALQGGCPFGQRFEKRCKYLRNCSTPLCQNPQPKENAVQKN